MELALYIQNGQAVFCPVLEGDTSWELNRNGQPGKLSFSVLADDRLNIEEGNAVRLDVDGKPVFFGFLFERSGGSDGRMKMTAYDQLRYLKNTDSYNYTDLTASELISKIAGDYQLQVGVLEDTGHKIKVRKELNKTLFDIILNALDLTMTATKNMFVLYDDVGKLTLKNISNMMLNLMIDKTTAQDYEFKSGIDSNTYNQISLYYDNSETKKQEVYLVKDSMNINKWGILQMRESIKEGEYGQLAAETYLSLYNRPTKSLQVKDAFGDVKVRAGCLVPTFLAAGDLVLKNYMQVETVTHKFSQGTHLMDLKLRGGAVNA